ncbi:MAG: hypothetical protein ACREXR_07395 [Gammaproteobacteria bacterium]
MPEPTVRLDLNNPVFQEALFRLEKAEQLAMLSTLRKIPELTWDQLYRDQGLKWEAIYSRNGPKGERIYSFRVTKKCRALVYREGEWLRILTLHPDHDSAYSG